MFVYFKQGLSGVFATFTQHCIIRCVANLCFFSHVCVCLKKSRFERDFLFPESLICGMSAKVKILLFFGTILGILIAAYVWWVPALAEKFAGRLPVSYEQSVGQQLYDQMRKTWDVDEERTRLLQLFYDDLNYDRAYNTKVTVVKSPEKNAFALPGGFIVVYTGILEDMPSAEALAALLAHETAHITQRHTLRNIMRSMGRGMLIALVTGNGDGVAGAILSRANELKGLEYSRELETEADNQGLAFMKKRKINPSGMKVLMEFLAEETAGSEPAAFMSTHPLFDTRIANIDAQLKNISEETKDARLNEFFKIIKAGEAAPSGDW